MDAIKAIKTRRSIRQFTEQIISDEIIQEILECAMLAPSARNRQPWHFIVVRGKEIFDAVSEAHPHAAMIKQAEAAILVVGDCSDPDNRMWVQDCSAATQNILLAAQALGVGTVWCGVYPRDERIAGMRQVFKVSEGFMPFALIPMGFPAEIKETPDRFDPTKIHHNSW